MPNSTLLSLSLLKPSKTNPRTHFDEQMLADLAANIKTHGLFQPLIVRPSWCQGCRNDVELQEARREMVAAGGEFPNCEIVDGERRFRAAAIAGLTELPCDVREMTDTLVIEIQLITFLQKESLLPLEESKGFQQLLALKDAAGASMHSAASIAASVGKKENYVYERLKLAELPAEARTALESGKIGTKVAVLIARIPGKEMRAAAAKEILHGNGAREPLSVRDAAAYVAEHCMTELKGAPFDLSDATLELKAGPCTTCPHRTGNNQALFGDVKRGDICTQPECFHRKCDAVWAVTSTARSSEANVKVLPVAEHAAFFQSWGEGTELKYDSEYVDINQKPAMSLLKHEVVESKVPNWRELLDGPKIFIETVPITIVRDGKNRLRELTLRILAVAGAIENGETIFATGAGKSGDASNASLARERKAEMEKHKKQQLIDFAATKAVRAAIAKQGIVERLWPILLELALGHAGHDGTWLISKRDGLKGKQNGLTSDLVRRQLATLGAAEQKAATVELLYMRSIRHCGVEGDEEFKAIAKLYGVDLVTVKAGVAAKAKPAKADPGKTAVAAVRASKPVKKGGAK